MFKKTKTSFIIGVDEVGRGALAGPVTVAAVAAQQNFKVDSKLKLRDSKKLTPLQREKWFKWIKERQKSEIRSQKLYFAVANVSPKTIDRINISNAANLAVVKALDKLIVQLRNEKINQTQVLLDGGLSLNKKNLKLKIKTIIKGDEKIPLIALASIVAKVTRDKLMRKLHKQYPVYGFNQNKGYGTKKHFTAIRKNGYCKIHRRCFLKHL